MHIPNSLESNEDLIKADLIGVRVTDIDGNLHHIGSEARTHSAVVLFLNTGCPIARKYTPVLNELYELTATGEIEFYGFSQIQILNLAMCGNLNKSIN